MYVLDIDVRTWYCENLVTFRQDLACVNNLPTYRTNKIIKVFKEILKHFILTMF